MNKIDQLAVKDKHIKLSLPALRTHNALLIDSTHTNSKIPKTEQEIMSNAIQSYAGTTIGLHFPFPFCSNFQWLNKRKHLVFCTKAIEPTVVMKETTNNFTGGQQVTIEQCIQCTNREQKETM
jgi:hypothetical protein